MPDNQPPVIERSVDQPPVVASPFADHACDPPRKSRVCQTVWLVACLLLAGFVLGTLSVGGMLWWVAATQLQRVQGDFEIPDLVFSDQDGNGVLPQAEVSPQPLLGGVHELIVHIDAQGNYSVGGQLRTVEELTAILNSRWDSASDRSVVLHAAENAKFELVVRAMDLCRHAGIDRISVMTASASEGETPGDKQTEVPNTSRDAEG